MMPLRDDDGTMLNYTYERTQDDIASLRVDLSIFRDPEEAADRLLMVCDELAALLADQDDTLMDTNTHLALAGLALCDALDEGATDSGARIKAVETARKHYHAVIGQQHGHRDPCVCPDVARGTCMCEDECICAAMANVQEK